jgi:Fungal Zn(2)-Cys(6) binuclear cluster domain
MAPAQDAGQSGHGDSVGSNFNWNGSGADESMENDESSASGDDEDVEPGAPGSKPGAPMQKRRRVTRACDECRRKKIKCDGKQPCTHCTVYSYGQRSLGMRSSRSGVSAGILTDQQTVPTINLRTEEETQHHNTSRPSRTDCTAPKRC